MARVIRQSQLRLKISRAAKALLSLGCTYIAGDNSPALLECK